MPISAPTLGSIFNNAPRAHVASAIRNMDAKALVVPAYYKMFRRATGALDPDGCRQYVFHEIPDHADPERTREWHVTVGLSGNCTGTVRQRYTGDKSTEDVRGLTERELIYLASYSDN